MSTSNVDLAKDVARIRARDDYKGCFWEPIPTEIDREFCAALGRAAGCGHSDRTRMARELTLRDADALVCAGPRLAAWGARTGDRGALVAVLMAMEFGEAEADFRNVLQLMSVWCRAAEIVGVSPEELEADVAEGLLPPTSRGLRKFLARPPADRSITSMGFREVGSGPTLTFEEAGAVRQTPEQMAAFMRKLVPRRRPEGWTPYPDDGDAPAGDGR